MNVEIFKTNVNFLMDAELLVRQIQKSFPYYSASFDLEDCDRILRIESGSETIQNDHIIYLLKYNNFFAEVLEDEIVARNASIKIIGKIKEQ
ncbi:MAG: hypothetical protein ACO1G9_04105 [Bacteroidota bacterium]